MRTTTLGNRTYASDPGSVRLSHAKLKELHPVLYEDSGAAHVAEKQQWWLLRMEEHLMRGDSRAALVVCAKPLLVAAYTDELDYSVVLSFPDDLAVRYHLEAGSRLLTVNLYSAGDTPVSDLENGPASLHQYSNFSPLIAEFLSDDLEKIEARKKTIAESEWKRCYEAAKEYATKNARNYRNGLPLHSAKPAR